MMKHHSVSENFTGVFYSYVSSIVHIGVYAMAITCPIVLLPVSDPAEGMSKGNMTYFLFYNGATAVYWSLASWKRLQKLCHRTHSIDGKKPFTIAGISPRRTDVQKYLLVTFVLGGLFFTAAGLIWGKNLERGYHMLYIPPILITIMDLIFYYAFLPEQEQTSEAFKMIFVYSQQCSGPVIMLFIPVVLKSMFDSVAMEIALPIIMTLMKEGLYHAANDAMEAELANCGYDGQMKSCGFDLHLEIMFQMGFLMMFPGEEEPLVLYTILILDIVYGAWTLWCVSHSDLTDEETFTDMTRRRAECDLPLICAPFLFLVMFTIIYFGWNTEHYHVYNCFDDSTYFSTIEFAAMHCGLQLLIFFIGNVLAHNSHQSSFLLMLKEQRTIIKQEMLPMTVNIAATSCLFTSCFFLKHDGLDFLSYMGDRTCNK
jgi:hypothetical protein